MTEKDVMDKIGKAVNFLAQVALVAAAVNEFALKAVEHVPTYAPIVAGLLAGQTAPFLRFGSLLGLFFGKK